MRFKYLLPALIWTVIIMVLISIPGSTFPRTSLFHIPHFDKLVHAGIFAVFTLLVNYGMYMQDDSFFKRNHYTISLSAGVIFGVLTEWFQLHYVPGRSGEWPDLLADLLGAVAGMGLFYYSRKYFPSFFNKY
jgi:VanZ family protein